MDGNLAYKNGRLLCAKYLEMKGEYVMIDEKKKEKKPRPIL